MMVYAPLGVTFAAAGAIVCSKRLRITVTWSDRSSGVSGAAAGKEGRRASWSHVRNGTIFSSYCSAADCAVISVYAVRGDIWIRH